MADTPDQLLFVSTMPVYQSPANPDHPAGDLVEKQALQLTFTATSITLETPVDATISINEQFMPQSITDPQFIGGSRPPLSGLKEISMNPDCDGTGGGGDCTEERPESGVVWP